MCVWEEEKEKRSFISRLSLCKCFNRRRHIIPPTHIHTHIQTPTHTHIHTHTHTHIYTRAAHTHTSTHPRTHTSLSLSLSSISHSLSRSHRQPSAFLPSKHRKRTLSTKASDAPHFRHTEKQRQREKKRSSAKTSDLNHTHTHTRHTHTRHTHTHGTHTAHTHTHTHTHIRRHRLPPSPLLTWRVAHCKGVVFQRSTELLYTQLRPLTQLPVPAHAHTSGPRTDTHSPHRWRTRVFPLVFNWKGLNTTYSSTLNARIERRVRKLNHRTPRRAPRQCPCETRTHLLAAPRGKGGVSGGVSGGADDTQAVQSRPPCRRARRTVEELSHVLLGHKSRLVDERRRQRHLLNVVALRRRRKPCVS